MNIGIDAFISILKLYDNDCKYYMNKYSNVISHKLKGQQIFDTVRVELKNLFIL